MKDGFGTEIRVNDSLVYATLNGHKPILTKAKVLVVEDARVKVQPLARSISGWRAPDGLPVKWLHQPENIALLLVPTYG